MSRSKWKARKRIRDNYFVQTGVEIQIKELSEDDDWKYFTLTKNLTVAKDKEVDEPPAGFREFDINGCSIRVKDIYVLPKNYWSTY